MKKGAINCSAKTDLISESESTLAFDANFAPGAVSGFFAMKKTIEKAKKSGIAVATVKNASHFGFAAYYALQAVKEDLIGFAFTSSGLMVAPFGGFERVLGTNPICVAVPAKSERPVVFDSATSNAAYNKSFFAYTEHRPIPEDWGLTPEGKSTTDPADIVKNGGALLPFGSYKGYGLAFIVHILTSILSGSAARFNEEEKLFEDTKKIGFNFAVLDISRFTDLSIFKDLVDLSIRRIKSSRKQDGIPEIYVPGEIEWKQYEKSQKEGLLLYEKVFSL